MSNLKQRNVAFWSIDMPIDAYRLDDAVSLATEAALFTSKIRTRLNRFSPEEIELLMQVGYAGADTSIRSRGFADNVPVADVSRLRVHP